MTKIGIIIGSTRPGRQGPTIAKWIYEIATSEKTKIEHYSSNQFMKTTFQSVP
ncbi:hypothetical protein N784_13170 [Pontibacillus litoralis JSM 072002]|uniref:NADPH-dependent FMN reductase-like domain-containing protein n=1 Tax=Pontibacillus litoralis JSM 072002 TaxID=1385512 RepID=A0A0A5G0K7_9BACI|nr:hypothetical protein N784_13170 [Pontibacillus litoralis JSM 072002]